MIPTFDGSYKAPVVQELSGVMAAGTPTILVVDDDASVRMALSRLFASVGYKVETFESAAEFFERVPRGRPGCILLDVQMPQTTGIELQQQLTEAGIDMPVIFVSAHADVRLTVDVMKAGALEVITKPFQEEVLLDAVGRAIAQDAARRLARVEIEELRRRLERLTPRERTVMSLVVTGVLNKQIAAALDVSEKTVKVHRARAMAKMQALSLPDLVRMADRLGLSPDNSVGSSVGSTDRAGVPKVQ